MTDLPRGFCTFVWSPHISFQLLISTRSVYQHLLHEFVNLVYML